MKPSEVIPAVIVAATAAGTPAEVVRNLRTEACRKLIEAKLVTPLHGYVIEVDPVAAASTKDDSVIRRGAVISDSVIILRGRMNEQTAPAGVTRDTMQDDMHKVVCYLLASQVLDASVQGPFLEEEKDDDGLIAYRITATVKTHMSVN